MDERPSTCCVAACCTWLSRLHQVHRECRRADKSHQSCRAILRSGVSGVSQRGPHIICTVFRDVALPPRGPLRLHSPKPVYVVQLNWSHNVPSLPSLLVLSDTGRTTSSRVCS